MSKKEVVSTMLEISVNIHHRANEVINTALRDRVTEEMAMHEVKDFADSLRYLASELESKVSR